MNRRELSGLVRSAAGGAVNLARQRDFTMQHDVTRARNRHGYWVKVRRPQLVV
ncbi:MAG: hypothetical protein M3R15_17835 [Acidobacteriota bacterium]|nr:hypothetical protein [Acidobacteriota bacterium]